MAENKLPKKFKEDTLDIVFSQITGMINEGLVHLPDDYSIPNALRQAWFKIKEMKGGKEAGYKPAIEICNLESIASSLLQMVTDGLSPAKSQCYFIVRKSGNTYNLDYGQQYQGKIALAKRYSNVNQVIAKAIYKDDVFVTTINTDGTETLKEHRQPLENLDNDIIGGYCVVIDQEGVEHLTKMSMSMIKKSWAMGSMKGSGQLHNDFSEEAVKRTLINKACKPWIQSTNDENVLPEEKNDLQSKIQVLDSFVESSVEKEIEEKKVVRLTIDSEIKNLAEPEQEQQTDNPY